MNPYFVRKLNKRWWHQEPKPPLTATVKWRYPRHWHRQCNLLGQVRAVDFKWGGQDRMNPFVNMDIKQRKRKPKKIRTMKWGIIACNNLGYKVVV